MTASPSSAVRAAVDELEAKRPRTIELTPMQMRVLREVCADGAPPQVIGKRMFLSHQTVRSHLWRIHQQAQTLSRAELVAAVLNGRIRPVLKPGGDIRG